MARRLLALVLVAVAGCEAPSTRVASAPPSTSREAQDHVWIENADGTLSYALDPSFDTTQTVRLGAVTWEYAGQTHFAAEPGPNHFDYTFEGDPPPITGLERAQKLRRFDSEGREWHVADVDIDAWAALIADANEEALRDGEAVPETAWQDPAEQVHQPHMDWEIGEEVSAELHSWSTGCTNGGGDNVWDDEDRVPVTDPAERQKTAAFIIVSFTSPNAVGTCSGVFLDDHTVLTAGHCFEQACSVGGADTFATSAVVCSYGNDADYVVGVVHPECRTSTDVVVPNFNATECPGTHIGAGDAEDDWAILNFTDDTNDFQFIDDMDTSTLTSLGSKTIHNLGFPFKIPGTGTCSANEPTPYVTSGIPVKSAQLFYQAGVDVTNFNNYENPARAKMDLMGQQSGSPVYYCSGTDDVCNTGEEGKVAMLATQFHTAGLVSRVYGPNIPDVRSDILLAIP